MTINDAAIKSGNFFVERMQTTHFKVCYEGNGINHMNINIAELNENNFQVGDEIAVFDGKICVGAVKLIEMDFNNKIISIPASSSDLDGANGFSDGNHVILKKWKSETNEEITLLPEIIEGEMIFNKQASVFTLLNNQSTSATDMFNNLQILIYPNPARSTATVRFSHLPEEGTKIILMDTMGKIILNRIVQNTEEILDIQHLPAGMYLVKTELYNTSQIQKLIKK